MTLTEAKKIKDMVRAFFMKVVKCNNLGYDLKAIKELDDEGVRKNDLKVVSKSVLEAKWAERDRKREQSLRLREEAFKDSRSGTHTGMVEYLLERAEKDRAGNCFEM